MSCNMYGCPPAEYYGGIEVPSTANVGSTVVPAVTYVNGVAVPSTVDLHRGYRSGTGILSQQLIGGITLGTLIVVAVVLAGTYYFVKKKK